MANYWLTNINYDSSSWKVNATVNYPSKATSVTVTNPTSDKVIQAIRQDGTITVINGSVTTTFEDVKTNRVTRLEFRNSGGWSGANSIDYIKANFPITPILDGLPTTATLGEYTAVAQQLHEANVARKGKLKQKLTDRKVPLNGEEYFDELIDKVDEIKSFPPGWDVEDTGEVYGSNVTEGDGVVWYRMTDLDNGAEESLWKFPELVYGSQGKACSCVGYSHDGQYLGFILEGYFYVFRKNQNGDGYYKIYLHPNQANWFDWHPHKNEFAVCASSLLVKFCSIEGETVTNYTTSYASGSNFFNNMMYCRYSPTGEYLYIRSADSTDRWYFVRVTENKTVRLLTLLGSDGTNRYTGGCAFTSDGKFLILCFDRHIKSFSIVGDTLKHIETREFDSATRHIDINFDNSYVIVTYDTSPYACLLRLTTGGSLVPLSNAGYITSPALHCKFSPTSNHIVIRSTRGGTDSSIDYKITIYAVENDNLVKKGDLSNSGYYNIPNASTIAFSPNGKEMAIADNKVHLYDLSGRQVICNYTLPTQPLLKIGHKRFGMANETKNIGEQCKVTLFPKLNMLGEAFMVNRLEELDNRVTKLEDNDKSILRGDMQSVAYNIYPEDFEHNIETDTDIVKEDSFVPFGT